MPQDLPPDDAPPEDSAAHWRDGLPSVLRVAGGVASALGVPGVRWLAVALAMALLPAVLLLGALIVVQWPLVWLCRRCAGVAAEPSTFNERTS